MRESCLRWFGHVIRRLLSAKVRKRENISWKGKVGYTSKYLDASDAKRHGIRKIDEQVALDKNEWHKKIHVRTYFGFI